MDSECRKLITLTLLAFLRLQPWEIQLYIIMQLMGHFSVFGEACRLPLPADGLPEESACSLSLPSGNL